MSKPENKKELEIEIAAYKVDKAAYEDFHKRYNHCLFCGKPHPSAHHVKFRSQGGDTSRANLCPLCPSSCHLRSHGNVVSGEQPFKVVCVDGGWIATTLDGEVLKEMSDKPHEPTELDGQNAYNLNENIKTHARIFQSSGLELGRLLYQMHENDMYQALGYESFKEYVSRELPIGSSMAYRLKQVAGHQERLQIESESLEGIAVDTLTYVLPKATADTVDDLLNQARSNSFSDLKADIEEEPIPDPSKPDPCPNCSMDCCPIKRGVVG